MEPLAYLYLAQAYESSEVHELVLLKKMGVAIALINFKRSGQTAIGLFSTVSAAWMLGTANPVLAEGYVFEEYVSKEHVPQEEQIPQGFVPVILGSKYVQSYAGGNYYYILEDKDFEDRPALAVAESSYAGGGGSYHPVRPEPAPAQPLCGVLKPGDSGSEVACLQEHLQKIGYFNGAITGYFGTITCDAVAAFQRDHGLSVDGIAGPQTLEVLNHVTGSV